MTVVAIDGPAGSGKSTVAREVAQRLGAEMLDTGALYRAITWAVLDANIDPADAAAAGVVAQDCVIRFDADRVFVGDAEVTEAIRGPQVSDAVSVVAAHATVRDALLPLQRDWINNRDTVVLEGRDMATVVAPDADVKVYLDADPMTRARRRADDGVFDVGAALANIEKRDGIDSSRVASPLTIAQGSVVIDTTELSLEQVIERVMELI